MTDKEKELAEKYLAYKDAEKEAKLNSIKTLDELSTTAPHKVGEIVKWTVVERKNVGTLYNPKYKYLPPVEKKAVLVRVGVSVWKWNEEIVLRYHYEFNPIKKDGGVSHNRCFTPEESIEWTGEIHKDYLNT